MPFAAEPNRKISPDYPAISLRDAVSRLPKMYEVLRGRPSTREDIAGALDYRSLSGRSRGVIAALIRYGLLEDEEGKLKLSETAKRILYPESEDERSEALRLSAHSPSLFRELSERFRGSLPGDEPLRNMLVRKGFNPAAAKAALAAYKDNLEFIKDPGIEELAGMQGRLQDDKPAVETAADMDEDRRQPAERLQTTESAGTPANPKANTGDASLTSRDDCIYLNKLPTGATVSILVRGSADMEEIVAAMKDFVELKLGEQARRP